MSPRARFPLPAGSGGQSSAGGRVVGLQGLRTLTIELLCGMEHSLPPASALTWIPFVLRHDAFRGPFDSNGSLFKTLSILCKRSCFHLRGMSLLCVSVCGSRSWRRCFLMDWSVVALAPVPQLLWPHLLPACPPLCSLGLLSVPHRGHAHFCSRTPLHFPFSVFSSFPLCVTNFSLIC